MIEEKCTWEYFYKWISDKGYHVYRNSNIFRHDKFITSFDPQEDSDSGEIEETIKAIKENDSFNFTPSALATANG